MTEPPIERLCGQTQEHAPHRWVAGKTKGGYPIPSWCTGAPTSPDPITLVGYELRYAAEQAAEAFRRFNKAMSAAIKKEKARLRDAEKSEDSRRQEREADYQRWKEAREGKINL